MQHGGKQHRDADFERAERRTVGAQNPCVLKLCHWRIEEIIG